MSVVLLGDSHLARIRRDLGKISPGTMNLAVGGATSRDLPRQLCLAHVTAPRCAVLSIGTNDANRKSGITLSEFTRALEDVIGQLSDSRLVYFALPGIDPTRIRPEWGWTVDSVRAYRDAALAACGDLYVRVIRIDQDIQPLGSRAFADDGLHLSGAGYAVAIESIRAELERWTAHTPAPASPGAARS